jgi:hypothetical protein
MASAMPSTGTRHFRNYPLTGHIADMAEPARMTRNGLSDRQGHATAPTWPGEAYWRTAMWADQCAEVRAPI